MIKLYYTQEDLITDPILRETVQMMMMLGAEHDGDCLTCTKDGVLPDELLKYVIHYDCMIKLAQNLREGEVFPGVSGREVKLALEGESEDIKILTREEWKPSNYDTPLLYEGYYYIPSDMMSREDAKILLQNQCEIITIEQYREIINLLSPEFVI